MYAFRLCGVSLALAAALPARGWTVAERGKPADCVIAVSSATNEVETFAAAELKSHVRRMTGVELPITASADGKFETRRAIILRSGAFPDDGFRIRVDGDRLLIDGGARAGVLYGVYELLEAYGACGWFSGTAVQIPECQHFTVPDNLDDRQIPAFAMRDTSWHPASSDALHAARCRLNGPRSAGDDSRFGGDNPFRFDKVLGNCHTFDKLVPPGRFFKEHPEYFSEVDGVRKEWPTQLCLTNPDVLAIVVSNVLERIRANPNCRFFGVSQNDWKNWCQCPRCRAIDEEEQSHAGTVIRFVNAVAEAVEKEFPDVVIETLAYTYTRKPPLHVRPRHNVMVCLCTIECDFSKPIPTSRFPGNAAFREDMGKWGEIASRLYVWDYTVNFANYVHIFPNVKILGSNIRFFRDMGARQVFEQGCGQAPHASEAELKTWLIGKYLWNPDLELEPLLDKFFKGYYGPAAPFARQIHDMVYNWNEERDEAVCPLGIYESVGNAWYSDDFHERCAKLWDAAWEAVKDSPEYRNAVRWARFGNDWTRVRRFMSTPSGGFVSLTSHPERIDQAKRAEMQRIVRERILPMRRESPQVFFAEGSPKKNDSLEKLLSDFATAPPAKPVASAELEEDIGYVLNVPKERGRIVDDPLAGNGKATMLHSGWGWSYYIPLDKGIGYDAGACLRLRIRARIDKVNGVGGQALCCGVYNYDTKRPSTVSDLELDAAAFDDGYSWFDVGTFSASSGDTIWVMPGRPCANGHYSYSEVYIDKFEISLADD